MIFLRSGAGSCCLMRDASLKGATGRTGLNCKVAVPAGGYVYQVKGNSMTSLTVQTNRATFNGKASIQDITDTLNLISIDGGATLTVNMTDNGATGDTIGITVWNNKNGGTWLSSNWNGTATVQQILAGGNLVAH